METSSEALEVNARPNKSNNGNSDMPPDMRFGEAQIITISGMSVLFVASALLNLNVLSNLLAARRTVGLSRLNTLLLQLVLADLLVRMKYREPVKGSSQVGTIYGGKIVSFCLQKVNKTQLSYLVSHNLGRAF